MIVRAGSGWQTVLADLALILFMVTVAALSQTRGDTPDPRPSAQSEPLAFYLAEPGAPPLSDWLGTQSPDSRQQLTILAQYRAGGQDAAIEQAQKLAREAGHSAIAARIVVEPGEGGTMALLAYDVPQDELAQSLLESEGQTNLEED